MNIDEIEIIPIASESMGVRSLCTFVRTPDVAILFDPSAALSKRYGLEPHPLEYKALQRCLKEIRNTAQEADILSISHYHYDHVRPGFRNCLYNLSERNERKELFTGTTIFAKDNRENINNSQRRRAYFFQKDVKSICKKLEWVDGKSYTVGETKIEYSRPLFHGQEESPLGYVLATVVEYRKSRFLFAPDVQGPITKDTLSYILSKDPSLAIIGGPPTYLNQFRKEESQSALYSLSNLASTIRYLIVDHHNMRDSNWHDWIKPVENISKQSDNELFTMARLANIDVACFEADRRELYKKNPPHQEFIDWTNASDEYKIENMPPL